MVWYEEDEDELESKMVLDSDSVLEVTSEDEDEMNVGVEDVEDSSEVDDDVVSVVVVGWGGWPPSSSAVSAST